MKLNLVLEAEETNQGPTASELVFHRTGDFWIDLGIASLWDSVFDRCEEKRKEPDGSLVVESDSFKANLTDDSLIITGQNILQELETSSEELMKELWGETKSGKMWWKGVALYFYAQQNTPSQVKQLLYPPKASGSVSRCSFCGREDQPTIEVRASESPLTVKLDKMMSFYSSFKGNVRICNMCNYASHFAAVWAFYRISTPVLNVFFIESTSLLDLAKTIKNRFSSHRVEATPYCNYKPTMDYCNGPTESFLDFLMSMWIGERRSLISDEDDSFSNKTFHVFNAKKLGNFTTFEKYYIIPDVRWLLSVFQEMDYNDKTGRTWNALQEVMNKLYVREGKTVNSSLREEFSRLIVTKGDILGPVEDYIFKALSRREGTLEGFYVFNMNMFVKKYMVMFGLEEQVLRNCKGLGDSLGTLVYEQENESILYTIRSTRNLEDLLEAVHQTLIRYMDEIDVYRKGVSEILEGIDETNWKTYRALIGIYAVLKYVELRSGRARKEA